MGTDSRKEESESVPGQVAIRRAARIGAPKRATSAGGAFFAKWIIFEFFLVPHRR